MIELFFHYVEYFIQVHAIPNKFFLNNSIKGRLDKPTLY